MSSRSTAISWLNIPIEAIVALCQRYQVRELALFGSVLRSDFRDDSDIDVLVAFKPDAQNKGYRYVRTER